MRFEAMNEHAIYRQGRAEVHSSIGAGDPADSGAPPRLMYKGSIQVEQSRLLYLGTAVFLNKMVVDIKLILLDFWPLLVSGRIDDLRCNIW